MTMNEDIQESDDEIRPVSERRKSRFVFLSETAMVAACMLIFFGFLTLLIRAFFPEGPSLNVDQDGSIIADSSWSGDVELGINATGGKVEQLFAG